MQTTAHHATDTKITLATVYQLLADNQLLLDNTIESAKLNQPVSAIAPLATATAKDIAFLANPKYRQDLATTQALAVLITPNQLEYLPSHVLPIVTPNPYLAYATISRLFTYQPQSVPMIHPTAVIAESATLGQNVQIGAYCVIGEQVIIGDNTRFESQVVIEDFVVIGEQCQLKSQVFVGHHCQIGHSVIVHSHASIGNAGFGFAPKGLPGTAGWQMIHQLGRVVIGNHVRIGSQTCIDRGALGDTVIGNHVIIDNLVQIAHNVQIGDGTAIAACTGIAGSSKIGKHCVLAGGVGVVGHIDICDDVTITGMTMVTKSITQAGSYSSGTAMMPTPLWKKAAIRFKQLVTA